MRFGGYIGFETFLRARKLLFSACFQITEPNILTGMSVKLCIPEKYDTYESNESDSHCTAPDLGPEFMHAKNEIHYVFCRSDGYWRSEREE